MARLGRRPWWVVLVTAAGGLLLSLAVVVGGWDTLPPADQARGEAAASRPAPSATPRPTVDAAPTSPPDGTAPSEPVGRSSAALRSAPAKGQVQTPQRVRIASVGIDVSVRSVGVEADRQMELPDDPSVLGWYRFGPAPGAGGGSAVLAGHLDSEEYGVGPLADLGSVSTSDVVRVRVGGRWREYRVDSIERFDQQALPDSVFARTGPERVRIVTCAGAYLPEAGGYQENLVVTALPV